MSVSTTCLSEITEAVGIACREASYGNRPARRRWQTNQLNAIHALVDDEEILDESNAGELRQQLAKEIGIPTSALASVRIARPDAFIPSSDDKGNDVRWSDSFTSQYLVGKHLEAVLTVNPSFGFDGHLEIAELEGFWESVGHCAPRRRAKGSITLEGLMAPQEHLGSEELGDVVVGTIRRLSETRRRRYRKCRFCKEMTPPEYRFDPDVCMGCASSEFGIVY